MLLYSFEPPQNHKRECNRPSANDDFIFITQPRCRSSVSSRDPVAEFTTGITHRGGGRNVIHTCRAVCGLISIGGKKQIMYFINPHQTLLPTIPADHTVAWPPCFSIVSLASKSRVKRAGGPQTPAFRSVLPSIVSERALDSLVSCAHSNSTYKYLHWHHTETPADYCHCPAARASFS